MLAIAPVTAIASNRPPVLAVTLTSGDVIFAPVTVTSELRVALFIDQVSLSAISARVSPVTSLMAMPMPTLAFFDILIPPESDQSTGDAVAATFIFFALTVASSSTKACVAFLRLI